MKTVLLTSLWLAPLAAVATSPSYTRGATTTEEQEPPECGLNCCPECDGIDHLPGYDAPLPSPWYSGYLTYDLGNHTIHTHYVLVMAERMQGEGTSMSLAPVIDDFSRDFKVR